MTLSTAISSTNPSTRPIFSNVTPWHFPDRPENILFRTKDPSSDIVIADFGMCVPPYFLTGRSETGLSHPYHAVPNISILPGSSSRPSQEVSDILLQRYSPLRATANLLIFGLLGDCSLIHGYHPFTPQTGSLPTCFSADTLLSDQTT